MQTLHRPRVCAVLAMLLPWSAWAECSRPVQVPVSASGLTMTVQGHSVGGIWPDFVRGLEAQSGCHFVFSGVTKARLERMLQDGMADVTLGNIRTSSRDQYGQFVPLLQARATVISVEPGYPAIQSAQDLLDRKNVRLVLVRGYDYGPDYQRLVAALSQENRVSYELDAVSVARVLQAAPTRLTIMTPMIFVGSVLGDPRLQGLLEPLRLHPIDALPWSDSGIYISNHALPPQDQAHLNAVLSQAAKSGEILNAYRKVYSEDLLKIAIRPVQPRR